MKIKYKDLKKILNNACVNPAKPSGPLKVILEQDNASFYEMRAQELISEARQILGPHAIMNDGLLALHEEHLTKAITLLGLAICLRKVKKN